MVSDTNRTALSKILIAAAFALSLVACSTGQTIGSATEPAPGPALWALGDDDTTIYLFGVAPVLKTGTEWETATITDAFNTADLFIIESENSSPEAQASVQALIPQIGLNTDGSTLSSKLSKEEQAELNAISTDLGAPLRALDTLKPWLASIQLGVLSISQDNYDIANPPAVQLVTRAAAEGKMMRSLEGPTVLLTVMSKFSEDEQIGMLMHQARTLRDAPTQQTELADAWLGGDVQKIGDILHGDGAWSSEVVYDTMLVQRNKAWLDELISLLADHDGTIFVTVGLGHLSGEDSLIEMLSDAGYAVHRQ